MAAAATVGSRPGHRTLTAKAVVSTLWEGCKKDWRPLCARKESALPRRGRNVFSDSFLQDGSFQSLPSAPLPQILVGLLQPAWFFVSLVPHRWSTEPDFSTAAKGCSYHSSISERSESLFALVLRFPSRARVLWVPFRAPAWRSPPPPPRSVGFVGGKTKTGCAAGASAWLACRKHLSPASYLAWGLTGAHPYLGRKLILIKSSWRSGSIQCQQQVEA